MEGCLFTNDINTAPDIHLGVYPQRMFMISSASEKRQDYGRQDLRLVRLGSKKEIGYFDNSYNHGVLDVELSSVATLALSTMANAAFVGYAWVTISLCRYFQSVKSPVFP